MTDETTVAIHPYEQQLAAAHEQIRQLTASLQFAESQLQQYSYAANHDLQEPLRKIQIYSGLLRDRNLSEADRNILDKILFSSGRMSALINDIVAYAEVSRTGKMLRPVDLNEVVLKIKDDFELAIEERGASLTLDKLPIVNAVPLEMNQLFYNLIANALKFVDPTTKPEITIRCKKLKSAAVAEYLQAPQNNKSYYDISVHDNGIGFNVQYAEQIFKVFKRLHPKDVYPGSGVGLSICRHIMANHQGALFVESKLGEGSAFHIIIPQ